MPVIVHIDMNSFFASCEVKRNPEYKGKKLVIGGLSSRSIVCAASYQAKACGVKSAMPTYKAKELCPDAIFLPVDHEYYYKVSNEIFDYLKSKYKVVNVASVDEAYIDMTDVYLGKDPYQYFVNLQKEIYEKMHIPCSIGVSFCTFLAKMGSDYRKPLGITIIKKKDVSSIIWPLPIEDMYGCGKASSAKLKELGINTIGDFVNSDDYKVKEVFGNGYDHMIALCKGEYANRVVINNEPIKSIGNSHTLDRNTDDYSIIKENLKYLCNEVSMRIRQNNMLAYTITLTLKDANFVSTSKSTQIVEPTDDNDKLFVEILKLLDKCEKKVIRLVGVSTSKLIFKDEYAKQLSIFSNEEIKQDNTELLINKLNNLVGKDIFKKAKDIVKNGRH